VFVVENDLIEHQLFESMYFIELRKVQVTKATEIEYLEKRDLQLLAEISQIFVRIESINRFIGNHEYMRGVNLFVIINWGSLLTAIYCDIVLHIELIGDVHDLHVWAFIAINVVVVLNQIDGAIYRVETSLPIENRELNRCTWIVKFIIGNGFISEVISVSLHVSAVINQDLFILLDYNWFTVINI
jgi:hypothetical protein